MNLWEHLKNEEWAPTTRSGSPLLNLSAVYGSTNDHGALCMARLVPARWYVHGSTENYYLLHVWCVGFGPGQDATLSMGGIGEYGCFVCAGGGLSFEGGKQGGSGAFVYWKA
jgi:hypothetical protein